QLRIEAFHRALDRLLSESGDRNPAEREALHALIAEYLMLGDTAARGDPLYTLYQMVRHLVDESRHQGLDLPELREWLLALPSASPPTLQETPLSRSVG
ncbi:MAG: hypothetical protein RMM10_13485, partial [Anaerolineae bacterium]|uniref:hypothetical protein n=1 Tax=Thermoflexus sp. TaxID=1969742 RepID=UPI0025D1F873